MKLHVLDGTYELFRSFFAMPSRSAPDGREVSAIQGLIQTTLSLLRQPEVSHVAAAFDHVIPSFRNDLFPGYKTGEGIDPRLASQFGLAEQALAALGVVVWPMVEFEADDAMATAARIYRADFQEIILLSPDKDLCQCVVDPKVRTHDRRREITRDEAAVRKKFGVGPTSIPDYLALVGDKADGIPGLRGWGARSTATVLAHYGRLDQIPADHEDWEVEVRGARRLAHTLAEQRQAAALYRELATLRTDVPLEESPEDLRWQGVLRDRYLELCADLGLSRRVRDLPHRWAEAAD